MLSELRFTIVDRLWSVIEWLWLAIEWLVDLASNLWELLLFHGNSVKFGGDDC